MRLRQNRGYGAGFSSFYPAMGAPAPGAAPGMYPAMGAAPAAPPAAPAMYPAMGGTASSPKFQKSLDDERRADALKAMAFSQSRAGGASMATADEAGYAAGKGAVAGLAPDYLARQSDAADANKRENAESGANVGLTNARAGDITAYGASMYPPMAAKTTAEANAINTTAPAEAEVLKQKAAATKAYSDTLYPVMGQKVAAEAGQIQANTDVTRTYGEATAKNYADLMKQHTTLQKNYDAALRRIQEREKLDQHNEMYGIKPPTTQPTTRPTMPTAAAR